MEGFLKKSDNRLPMHASWPHKRPLMPPLAVAPPLPPPASFQQWKKFHYGDSSNGTVSVPFQQPRSDGKSIMIKPSDQGLSDKKLSATDGGDDDAEEGVQFRRASETDKNMDRKKLRRVMSNRLSAQKSRIQRNEYVSDMERRVKDLQVEIEICDNQFEILKHRKQVLEMENQFLTKQLHAYSMKRILNEAEIEHNKAEVNWLSKLHMSSNQPQKMQAKANGDQNQMVPNHGGGMGENPRGMTQERLPTVYGQHEGDVEQMMSSTKSLSSRFGRKFI